jgi:hypothetical protein
VNNSSRKRAVSFRTNLQLAKQLWGDLPNFAAKHLKELTEQHCISVATGDLQLLEGRWYITHAGLLRIAQKQRCTGIKTSLEHSMSSPEANRWVFKATVYKKFGSTGFVGYGDADPSNVSSLTAGAELRIAETRAVNRALRKAYAVGLCSVEELGSLSRRPQIAPSQSNGSHTPCASSGNGQPRLRDQLSLLVRKFNLDATLVKAYAADFCGSETLSGASRDLVESFISHLSASATQNRDALICKLNSYSRPQEATQ